jgi:hypothetical protein
MKNLIVFVSLFFMLSLAAQAQSTVRVGSSGDSNLAYEKGDKIFLAGITFGSYGYGFVGTRGIGVPPLTAALELGIHENFSVGPYVGYASYNYDWIGFDYSYNFLSVGARGSFHYVPLLNEALDLSLDEEKLDFYVSLLMGLEFQTFSGESNGTNVNFDNDTEFIFAPVLGFKYKFNDKFGVYFEGGRGAFGYGTIGVAVHF